MSEQSAAGTDPAPTGPAGGDDDELYHGYSVDDEDQPQDTEDSLTDRRDVADPLDEGYSPPEKWSAGQRWGNTPLEEAMGSSLDQRLEAEETEPDPYVEAEAEAERDEDDGGAGDDPGDQWIADEQAEAVGRARAGRLVDPDEGVREDVEKDLVGRDVGIDGAGAGAEEAAVHVVDEDDIP